MKDTLKPGLTAKSTINVDDERVIGFMGDDARVYATPSLVRDIEMTSRDLLLAHLDEGEDSVGTRVEIDHIAATPYGMDVEIVVTIAAVDRRAITLDVEARDKMDKICKGRHNRFVVDIKQTVERLKAKSEAAGV
jgi:predicted thioesterase